MDDWGCHAERSCVMLNEVCHAELDSASRAQRRSRVKLGMTAKRHAELDSASLVQKRSRNKFGMTVGQARNDLKPNNNHCLEIASAISNPCDTKARKYAIL